MKGCFGIVENVGGLAIKTFNNPLTWDVIREVNAFNVLKSLKGFVEISSINISLNESSISMRLYNSNLQQYIISTTLEERKTYANTIMSQLYHSLLKLGENNLIHEDIKPDNILLRWENKNIVVVLCDFGSCIDIRSVGTNQWDMECLAYVMIYYLQDTNYLFSEYVDEVIDIAEDYFDDFCKYIELLKPIEFDIELLAKLVMWNCIPNTINISIDYPIWIQELKRQFDLDDIVYANTLALYNKLLHKNKLYEYCCLYISVSIIAAHGRNITLQHIAEVTNTNEKTLSEILVTILNTMNKYVWI